MIELRLTTSRGEVRVALGAGQVVVGRDPACDVVLDDSTLSRRHVAIEAFPASGEAMLRDLGSSNGTWVDDRRVEGPQVVRPGQQLRFGTVAATLHSAHPPAPAAAAPSATILPAGAPATAPPPTPAFERPAAPALGPFPPTPFPSAMPQPAPRPRRMRTVGLLVALVVVLVGALVTVLVVTGRDTPGVEEVVADATPLTVLVASSVGGERIGSGTGWVLDGPRGLVVTNHHVIGFADEVEIGFDDRLVAAEVVGTAPCEDIAVLSVDGMPGLGSIPLGDQDALRLGQTVVALGFPGNASMADDLSATTGVVSIARTTLDEETYDAPNYSNLVQTDAAINPGNSGGPLLDLDGRLVGMNSAGITLQGGRIIQGQGYAIGVDRLREVLPALGRGDSPAWLGLGLVHPLAEEEFLAFGLEPGPGLIVTGAVPGTPAAGEDAAQEPGLLLEVQGEAMDGSLPAYCEALEGLRSGDRAEVLLLPGAEPRPVAVELTLG